MSINVCWRLEINIISQSDLIQNPPNGSVLNKAQANQNCVVLLPEVQQAPLQCAASPQG